MNLALPIDQGEPAESDEFDALPEALQNLVREGMAKHAQDPAGGEFLFNYAISQAPEALPLYRVLYKFSNRRRRFDIGYDFASRGLAVATRQAGLDPDWQSWTAQTMDGIGFHHRSFLLLTLKAMAFIELRRGNPEQTEVVLQALRRLDPGDGIGASVIAALADGVQA